MIYDVKDDPSLKYPARNPQFPPNHKCRPDVFNTFLNMLGSCNLALELMLTYEDCI